MIWLYSTLQVSGQHTMYGLTKITEDLPLETEDLLKWTINKFGGVTSFTEVLDPGTFHFKSRPGKTLCQICWTASHSVLQVPAE